MAELARSGQRFALATVVRTHGSTPQVVGAKLVITEDTKDTKDPKDTEGAERRERRQAMGTLGGGCVEADAILAARDVLARGGRSLRAYELTEDLAWNTGLVCGGTMWILAERGEDVLTAGGESVADLVAGAARGGPAVAWVTRRARDGRGFTFDRRVFVEADGTLRGTLGSPALDARASAEALTQMRHGAARLLNDDETHDLL